MSGTLADAEVLIALLRLNGVLERTAISVGFEVWIALLRLNGVIGRALEDAEVMCRGRPLERATAPVDALC